MSGPQVVARAEISLAMLALCPHDGERAPICSYALRRRSRRAHARCLRRAYIFVVALAMLPMVMEDEESSG